MSTPTRARTSAWWAEAVDSSATGRVRLVGSVALAVALVTAAAHLAVPVPGTPVPITLQDLAVLVVGVVLGPARGAAALVTYVGLGALGAPVFSNGHGGLAWLMGPTGGYLLAYPAAAYVVGAFCHPRRGRRWWVALAGILAAQALVFAGGGLQLALLTGQGPAQVVSLAVVPFLPGVAMKSGFLLAFVVARARRSGGRDRS